METVKSHSQEWVRTDHDNQTGPIGSWDHSVSATDGQRGGQGKRSGSVRRPPAARGAGAVGNAAIAAWNVCLFRHVRAGRRGRRIGWR